MTGEGIPSGHPLASVIEVCAAPGTLEAVPADVDVDARTADVDFTAYIESVAAGAPCRAERHEVTSFATERVGPSM